MEATRTHKLKIRLIIQFTVATIYPHKHVLCQARCNYPNVNVTHQQDVK